jgi:hypothetical protein
MASGRRFRIAAIPAAAQADTRSIAATKLRSSAARSFHQPSWAENVALISGSLTGVYQRTHG